MRKVYAARALGAAAAGARGVIGRADRQARAAPGVGAARFCGPRVGVVDARGRPRGVRGWRARGAAARGRTVLLRLEPVTGRAAAAPDPARASACPCSASSTLRLNKRPSRRVAPLPVASELAFAHPEQRLAFVCYGTSRATTEFLGPLLAGSIDLVPESSER